MKIATEFDLSSLTTSTLGLISATAFDYDIRHLPKTAVETALRTHSSLSCVTSFLELGTAIAIKHCSSFTTLKKCSPKTKYLLTAATLGAIGLMIGSGGLTLTRAASYSWSIYSNSTPLTLATSQASSLLKFARAGANTMHCLSLASSGVMKISAGIKIASATKRLFPHLFSSAKKRL